MAITFTAAQLLARSYQLVGVLASGDPMPSYLAEDGLAILNGLLDAYATQRLMLPAQSRDIYAYAANVNTYTIGVGATWNATRPSAINGAAVLSFTADPAFEIPMDVIDDQAYMAITQKDLTATFPLQLYYNADNAATGTIFVWPTPTDASSYRQVLYTPTQLTTFANLTSTVVMAPGYYRMLYYNVAVELGEQNQAPIRPNVERIARESLLDVKRLNLEPLDLMTDPALPGANGIYNIYSDVNY